MKNLILLLIVPFLTFGQVEPTELCDSINTTFTGTGTIPGNSISFMTIQITTEYISSYWFPYCGLILTNEMEETIGSEELGNAVNAYGLGPGMTEERVLTIFETIDYPFTGTINLANHLFSGPNPEIICSWPITINNLNVIELSKHKNLLKKIDILGRDPNSKGFNIEIYDDGSVEKKYVIECE